MFAQLCASCVDLYCYILTFDRLVSLWISKSRCLKVGKQGTAEMPWELHRWDTGRKNDRSFQPQVISWGGQSVGSQQSRQVTLFWVLVQGDQQPPRRESWPCISLLWKKHKDTRLPGEVSQTGINLSSSLFIRFSLSQQFWPFVKNKREYIFIHKCCCYFLLKYTTILYTHLIINHNHLNKYFNTFMYVCYGIYQHGNGLFLLNIYQIYLTLREISSKLPDSTGHS